MTVRNRQWLRTFLNLGHRAEKDGVPMSDVLRQEDTVVSACQMLDQKPGIVLADEVGMGKTFEALGIASVFHHAKPKCRIVILTPGPDLNGKWVSEFSRFPHDFGSTQGKVAEALRLREFVDSVKKNTVTVAPVSMFQSGRGRASNQYMLSLYCHWKQLHGLTANAMISRFEGCQCKRVDVTQNQFLGSFSLDEISRHLKRAFTRLDALYETDGLAAFANQRAIRRALSTAKSYIAGRMLPLIDLLIVDEAHKLKNARSLRSEAIASMFRRRFNKAVFMTATPFQLDIAELREVFRMFSVAKGATDEVLAEVDVLLGKIREYQECYDAFQRNWCSLDNGFAATFSEAYDRSPDDAATIDDPNCKVLLDQIGQLRSLKDDDIEPGFRRWMIRSLRDEKRVYRSHCPKPLPAVGDNGLPFLIYERLIAELFRQRQPTHKAAAEINMVSSYSAARNGAILAEDLDATGDVGQYRELLRDLLQYFRSTSDRQHPKLDFVVQDSLDAADRGEKTLIFCARIATLQRLRQQLDGVWERRILQKWQVVYPNESEEEIFGLPTASGESRGRQSLLQRRFHRPQDVLYLALREPYLQTIEPIATWASDNVDAVVERANRLLRTLRVGKTAATRTSYQLAKRCVERAAAELWLDETQMQLDSQSGLRRLCDPNFLMLGLDLKQDDYEEFSEGNETPEWRITERTASVVLGQSGSLWERLSDQLGNLNYDLRVQVVEQLARYLTFKQVPFLADLLVEAKNAGLDLDPIGSEPLLHFLPTFWQSAAGQEWIARLREFLKYFAGRDPEQQSHILAGSLRTGDFARHTQKGESRERLREAFNTPLFPMVLVANEVMQEGLDLHKNCRRIVHHDLGWNPAQIEQRIGRIDRLGSLTSRLRQADPKIQLEILYPLIQGTIDQRLYQTVKTREKWLEFLLGAPPNFSEFSFSDEEPPPLPARLATELSINLAPDVH